MKTFFTQPIGQLARQNALGFIVCNVFLLVVGFGELDVPVGLGNLLNFLWGIFIIVNNYCWILFGRRSSAQSIGKWRLRS